MHLLTDRWWLVSFAGLSSQQWGQKKAAGNAIVDLAEAGGAVSASDVATLLPTLLQVSKQMTTCYECCKHTSL